MRGSHLIQLHHWAQEQEAAQLDSGRAESGSLGSPMAQARALSWQRATSLQTLCLHPGSLAGLSPVTGQRRLLPSPSWCHGSRKARSLHK